MPDGFSAQGTIIARSIDPNWPPEAPVGGAVSFTDIAELKDTTPPNLTRNPLETTTHNEEDDAYLVGIRRHGDLTFQINFVPANATHDENTGLQQAWFDGTRDIYRITYPSGNAWLFSGFVTGFNVNAPVDGILTADVTIRPTGRHAWEAAP